MRANQEFIRNLVRALIVISALILAAPAHSSQRNEMPVSLVQLLANPQKYEHRFVWVIGYLERLPNLMLYLTKNHARIFDIASAIDIHDTTAGGELILSTCVSNWVRVRGVFGMLEGVYPAIVDVEEVVILESHGSCWKRSGREPNAHGAADKDKVE